MVKEIYGQRNLSYTTDQLAARLVEEIAELVEPINAYNVEAIPKKIADILPWACSVATSAGVNLEEAMRAKYLVKRPGKGASRLDLYGIIGKESPESFEDWQTVLKEDYKSENINLYPIFMLAKLVEDVGTASRTIKKGLPKEETADKLAGVLAWTLAIASKFRIDLARATWDKYPGICWRCTNKPCTCFSLTKAFVSYTSDTEPDKDEVVSSLSREMLLNTMHFGLLQEFQKERMAEVLVAVAECDSGIVLLHKKFSPNVYVEVIEMLSRYDSKNLWIFVKEKDANDRDELLNSLIDEMTHHRHLESYETTDELLTKLKHLIRARRDELKQLRG